MNILNDSTSAKRMNCRALGICCTILVLLLCLSPKSAHAQPTPNPPGQISYQGFLVDGNGVPLATNTPVNYDVIFRIYNVPIGNNPPLWGELQTVTVDRGYFSVLLGQGSSVPGAPNTNNLTALFVGPDASDRYIGVTVKGLGGTDVEIQPRMRLLASPYSFLAGSANALIDANGQPLILNSGGNLIVSNAMQLRNGLTVNGNLGVTGTITAGGTISGANLAVTGNITSPKWNVTAAIPYGGCSLPNSGGFSSSGGTLVVRASGSGWQPTAGAIGGMSLVVDGSIYGTMYRAFSQANIHGSLPGLSVIIHGLPAGNHSVQLTSFNGFLADCSDNNEVIVEEFPF